MVATRQHLGNSLWLNTTSLKYISDGDSLNRMTALNISNVIKVDFKMQWLWQSNPPDPPSSPFIRIYLCNWNWEWNWEWEVQEKGEGKGEKEGNKEKDWDGERECKGNWEWKWEVKGEQEGCDSTYILGWKHSTVWSPPTTIYYNYMSILHSPQHTITLYKYKQFSELCTVLSMV